LLSIPLPDIIYRKEDDAHDAFVNLIEILKLENYKIEYEIKYACDNCTSVWEPTQIND
jgi:hypothetical protein